MTRRPLLRWLLFSRRRFLLVVLGAGLAVIVLFRVVNAEPTAAEPVPVPPPSKSTGATSSAPPPPDPTTAAPVSLGGPQAVALRFATLWVDTADPGRWLARLTPLATDEYAGVTLPQADPLAVPASRVTGAPRQIASGRGQATVLVPLDTMTLRVELVDVTGHGAWRVADTDRQDPAAGGGR